MIWMPLKAIIKTKDNGIIYGSDLLSYSVIEDIISLSRSRNLLQWAIVSSLSQQPSLGLQVRMISLPSLLFNRPTRPSISTKKMIFCGLQLPVHLFLLIRQRNGRRSVHADPFQSPLLQIWMNRQESLYCYPMVVGSACSNCRKSVPEPNFFALINNHEEPVCGRMHETIFIFF